MRGFVLGLCVALCAIACGGDDDADDSAAAGSGGNAAQANPGSGGRGGAGGAIGTGGIGTGGKSGGTGVNIDPNSSTARTAACIEYVRGFCEGRHACGDATDPQLIDRCLWQQARTCPDRIFSEGSTRTVEATIACADEWRALPCVAASMGASPDCSLPGTREVGEPCVYATQCASLACDGLNMMCGTCIEAQTRCAADPDCGDAAVCIGGRCFAAEPDAGAPIEMEPLELGESCAPGGPQLCVADGYCRTIGDGASNKCTRLPRLGENCGGAFKCEVGNSYCDSSQTCVALPAAGAACATDFAGVDQCPNDTYCDITRTATPICRAIPKLGEACRGRCEAKAFCTVGEFDMEDGTCVRSRMPGQSCTDPNDACLPGATRCESGVCKLVESQGLAEQLCNP